MIDRDSRDAILVGATTVVPTVEAMQTLGAGFGERAAAGDVLALYGDLGAGKTEFVRGFAGGVGIDPSAVTSPTFTLIHEYGDGRMPIYHFDAYRIERPDELVDLGLDEYLFGGGVCLIEWPGVIEHLLPDHTLRLRIEHASGGTRRVRRDT